MASCLSISCPLPHLLRRQLSYSMVFPSTKGFIQFENSRAQKLYVQAVSKKSAIQQDSEDESSDEGAGEAPKKTKRAPRRTRKKKEVEAPEENNNETIANLSKDEDSAAATPAKDAKKPTRRGRKKAVSAESSDGEVAEKKTTRRRTRKKVDPEKDDNVSGEVSDPEESTSLTAVVNETEELYLREDEGEDISYTYSWPPLVCCFGAARHAFIPSGRPANRLIDHEIHESMKDVFWEPGKFVRAPGRSSCNVAIALATIGGRVAFMGKLGDDEYGQSLLYHLNVNNVQTRGIVIDASRATAVSQMKIARRGGLKMSCVKPCAEDSFTTSDINIDILKEAKMLYFNSSSLLDENMRWTTMQAIKACKKFGGVIFFDLNLPLPLWASNEETRTFIQSAWDSADIIEVTKQELEFLCGIKPNEKFDTKDNDKSKFVHHKPEVIKTLWHENLRVLFVTNGTSKIHYYTEKDNGCVLGMEDTPLTPFTGDMSISADAIVAALMRMLTVQPHLATDKGYLEHMIKYAINCGVIDQWLLARELGFPPKEGMKISSSSESGIVRSISEMEFRNVEEKMVEELVT